MSVFISWSLVEGVCFRQSSQEFIEVCLFFFGCFAMFHLNTPTDLRFLCCYLMVTVKLVFSEVLSLCAPLAHPFVPAPQRGTLSTLCLPLGVNCCYLFLYLC